MTKRYVLAYSAARRRPNCPSPAYANALARKALVSLSGAVYRFARTGLNWTQSAYVKASDMEGSAEFGVSVTLSSDGSTLGVGRSLLGDTGAAYVYIWGGNAWAPQHKLLASVGDQTDRHVPVRGDFRRNGAV